MDIKIGTELDIRSRKIYPVSTVTVVGMRLVVEGDTMRCVVTIADLDGLEEEVGAFHLVRWVEMAER